MITRLATWWLRRKGWYVVEPGQTGFVLTGGSVTILPDITATTVNLKGGAVFIKTERPSATTNPSLTSNIRTPANPTAPGGSVP